MPNPNRSPRSLSESPCRAPCPAWRLSARSFALVAVLAAAACASDDTTRSGLLSPYRSDLPQGNYLTRAMLDEVRVGMAQREVQRMLGSPLLVDVFQPDRWNYVFRFRHPNGRVDLRKVVIRFGANDQVVAIDADELPVTESPSDPALPGFRREAYGQGPESAL